ncbi:MAG TPA: hypothetical protein EYO58_07530 [Flavobacteriales bacterium]|nr:hypothetical protein [Flavobacteriales bacterium]
MKRQILKYWDERNLRFKVLSFSPRGLPDCDLFSHVLVGENFSDETPWHQALNVFFETLEEDYFFLCFEDHFLIDNVNTELFHKAEENMRLDKSISKIRLLPKYHDHQNLEEYDENFWKAPTKAHGYVHTSLRPSLWRKDFFLKLLKNPWVINNPFEFEYKNDPLIFSETVLIPRDPYPLFPDLDAMRKGVPNELDLPRGEILEGEINMDYYKLNLKKEDIEVFNEVRKKWRDKR